MDKIMADQGTEIILVPGFHGEACPGNGENPEMECCCDECDFYLLCFPDWAEKLDNYPEK